MTELSEDELKLVRAHPLNEDLGNFRTVFQSRYVRENTNVKEVVDRLTTEAFDNGKGFNSDYLKVTNKGQQRRISYLTSS